MIASPLPNHRLPTLDALRALAVLLVVAQHLIIPASIFIVGSPVQLVIVPTGAIGVNLFFIISGFCIPLTAANCGTLRLFLIKRFTRIYVSQRNLVFSKLPDGSVFIEHIDKKDIE